MFCPKISNRLIIFWATRWKPKYEIWRSLLSFPHFWRFKISKISFQISKFLVFLFGEISPIKKKKAIHLVTGYRTCRRCLFQKKASVSEDRTRRPQKTRSLSFYCFFGLLLRFFPSRAASAIIDRSIDLQNFRFLFVRKSLPTRSSSSLSSPGASRDWGVGTRGAEKRPAGWTKKSVGYLCNCVHGRY